MSRDEVVERLEDWFDVSRETIENLDQLAELLEKWTKRINLVSKGSVDQVWERHILDSAQVFAFVPRNARSLTDIGSGGGFPGLVLSILAAQLMPDLKFTMIESDVRKCAFLQTVSHQLGLGIKVVSERIEAVDSQNADVITARALAPLPNLLRLVSGHIAEGGTALLMKGVDYQTEIDESLASWRFDLQKEASKTSDDAMVLLISNLRPA